MLADQAERLYNKSVEASMEKQPNLDNADVKLAF